MEAQMIVMLGGIGDASRVKYALMRRFVGTFVQRHEWLWFIRPRLSRP
jgi:hypothetical protein